MSNRTLIMRYVSTYYNQNLEKGHEKYQLTFSGVIALVLFGAIASFYDTSYDGGMSRKARFIYRAINGFKNMDGIEVLMTGLTSFLLGLIVLFILENKFQKRNIIVAYEINEENKTLQLDTKLIGSSQRQSKKYKLSEIAFSHRKLKDGLNKDSVDCIVFKKDLQPIGFLFINHPMWMNYSKEEFQSSLDLIKLLIT